MTVDERVKLTVDELFWGIRANPTRETIAKYMVEALRDQIEDCAKVAREEIERWDRQFLGELRESVVFEIRALAGKKEGGE